MIIAGDLNAKHNHWHSRISNNARKALYRALPHLDVLPFTTTEPTHYSKQGSSPDVLDMALIKDINITNEPHALNSDHIRVLLTLHQLHSSDCRSLPPIYTTDWDSYCQVLATTATTTIPLTSLEDIDTTVELITANICSPLHLNTKSSAQLFAHHLRPSP